MGLRCAATGRKRMRELPPGAGLGHLPPVGAGDARQRRVGLGEHAGVAEPVAAQPRVGGITGHSHLQLGQAIPQVQPALAERGIEPRQPGHRMAAAVGVFEHRDPRHAATAFAMHRPRGGEGAQPLATACGGGQAAGGRRAVRGSRRAASRPSVTVVWPQPEAGAAINQAGSRSVFAAATICSSAGITSLHWRVFRPQSGLTQSRCGGMRRAALRISATM